MTGLTNLILLTGGDELRIQPLDQAITSFKAAGRRTPGTLTFATEEVMAPVPGDSLCFQTNKLGIVVWFDRDAVQKAFSYGRPGDVEHGKYQKLLTLQLALKAAIGADVLTKAETEDAQTLRDLLNARLSAPGEPI